MKDEISFEGEETLGREAQEKLNKENDGINDEIYPDAEVNIARDPVSVFQLKRKYDKQPKPLLVLDPDFQREEVWNPKQKSELIESILMGIPLPLIYVKEDNNGVYIIVDGRQRLTTLFDFMNGKFRLKGLKILGYLNGKSFSTIDEKQQNKIEDCSLTLHVIKPPTSDRVTFDLFDRVNRGGTRLNNQEMRNALYQGYSTQLLNRLSKSESFKKVTENSIPSKRMKDRYLILRFLSFYLWRQKLLRDIKTGELVEYRSDLEDFLGKSMLFINDANNRITVDKLEELFKITMKNCIGLLGEGCFRLPQGESRTRKPINMALFETISCFCAILKDVANKKSNLIKENYKILISGKDFIRSLTYTVDSNISVYARFDKIESAAKEILNA
jgi:uncharacterized protein DUF262